MIPTTTQLQPSLFGDLQGTCPICRRTITPAAPCPHVAGTGQTLWGQDYAQLQRRRRKPAAPPPKKARD
jgi:hypothetical protein